MRLLLSVALALSVATTAFAQHVSRQAWNAPDGVAAGWTKPQEHNHDDGIALSADGGLLAVASMFRPVSEIRMVDLKAKTGWRLVHPDWRLNLSDPVFSPDGKRLAVVVGVPVYRGVTEIWILDIATGKTLQRIGAPQRSYRQLAFSPDGRRIAYFRDVVADLPPDTPIFPEFALKPAFALFEHDLTTGVETRLAEQAFSYPCGLAYQGRDEGFFYCVLSPQEWAVLAPGIPERWISRRTRPGEPNDLAHDEANNYSRVYYVRRGEQMPALPQTIVPEGQPKQTTLVGARSDGAVLTMASGPQEFSAGLPLVEFYTAYTPGSPPEEVDVYLSAVGCSKRTASVDGRVFALEGDCLRTQRGGGSTPKPSSFFVTRDGKLEILRPKDIAFEPTVRTITPPEGSRFATTPPTGYQWGKY